MKDEKILKKVGKLLTLYGVDEDEKAKFIADLQDKKYDDQDELEENEELEEVNETEEVEELPAEEPASEEPVEEVSEDAEEPLDEEPAEPVEEEPLPEEPVADEQPSEELPPVEEQPLEQPSEELPQENNDLNLVIDELKKTIEGQNSRIESLEDLVKKLGTPVEESVGVEPHNPSGESFQESELDRINRLRMGR